MLIVIQLIRIYRIPEGNSYDVLLSIFGRIGTPLFKSLVDYGRGERDGDKLALSVEKHLSEVCCFKCGVVKFHTLKIYLLRHSVIFRWKWLCYICSRISTYQKLI